MRLLPSHVMHHILKDPGVGHPTSQAIDFQSFISHRQSHAVHNQVEGSWDKTQKLCARVYKSAICQSFLIALIILSFILMVMEADFGDEVPAWLNITDNILMVIYTAEMCLRLFVFRGFFFHSTFNNIDFLVVIVELGSRVPALITGVEYSEIPSVAALRVLRLLRLARGYKVIIRFPQLALIVKGLAGGASAAIYGAGLLLVVLTICSVFAVHVIDDVNQRVSITGIYAECERCPHAFSNVRSSIVTFFQQIIAGDSWGQVTIPIMEEAPETAVFFAAVFITVHFTIMNVILAVIVDSALKASQEELGELLKRKEASVSAAKDYLMEICASMDTDRDGEITAPELIEGFDANIEFHNILASMDINKDELHIVFNILDSDESGQVDYSEFVNELVKMKQHDSHTMLVFIKHYATEIRKDVREQLNLLKNSVGDQVRKVMREETKTLGSVINMSEVYHRATPSTPADGDYCCRGSLNRRKSDSPTRRPSYGDDIPMELRSIRSNSTGIQDPETSAAISSPSPFFPSSAKSSPRKGRTERRVSQDKCVSPTHSSKLPGRGSLTSQASPRLPADSISGDPPKEPKEPGPREPKDEGPQPLKPQRRASAEPAPETPCAPGKNSAKRARPLAERGLYIPFSSWGIRTCCSPQPPSEGDKRRAFQGHAAKELEASWPQKVEDETKWT